jgi:hypothetical protein
MQNNEADPRFTLIPWANNLESISSENPAIDSLYMGICEDISLIIAKGASPNNAYLAILSIFLLLSRISGMNINNANSFSRMAIENQITNHLILPLMYIHIPSNIKKIAIMSYWLMINRDISSRGDDIKAKITQEMCLLSIFISTHIFFITHTHNARNTTSIDFSHIIHRSDEVIDTWKTLCAIQRGKFQIANIIKIGIS